MTHFPRRQILALAALPLLPRRLRALPDPWGPLADRGEALEQLHAVVVLKDGETVFDRAFRGPATSRAVNIKSVSKSVVSALTGAAIDRGAVQDVRATLAEVAPQLIPDGADPRVRGLTLENLVTLRAGLERTSGPNYGAWVSSRNWVADALGRPFVAEPGGRMLYSTGSFHILGAALAQATDRSLLALARDWLGAPLGIDIPPWTRDPQGFYLGGNEMALSPVAMARLGEVYRTGGLWQGQRVLPADWVRASLMPRTRSPFSGLDYGYGWFLGRAGGSEIALARGYGGQVICVAPGLGTTVAITSDPTRPARSGGYFGDLMTLLAQNILPTARSLG